MNDLDAPINSDESLVGTIVATVVVTIAAVVAAKGLLDTAKYFRRKSAEKKKLDAIIEPTEEKN
jgi:hypothetical protein